MSFATKQNGRQTTSFVGTFRHGESQANHHSDQFDTATEANDAGNERHMTNRRNRRERNRLYKRDPYAD